MPKRKKKNSKKRRKKWPSKWRARVPSRNGYAHAPAPRANPSHAPRVTCDEHGVRIHLATECLYQKWRTLAEKNGTGPFCEMLTKLGLEVYALPATPYMLPQRIVLGGRRPIFLTGRLRSRRLQSVRHLTVWKASRTRWWMLTYTRVNG